MAISLNSRYVLPILIICVSFFFTLFFSVYSDSDSDSDSVVVAELLTLQFRSKSGVVHLDDRSIKRFLTSKRTPRPYAVLLFFNAEQLHNKPELHLQGLLSEFEILASSFIFNNKDTPSATKLFFCEIEFKESQSTFVEFGINTLPHMRLIDPNAKTLKDSEQVTQVDFSRLAEGMAEFIQLRTKLSVGPIKRPPMFTVMQLSFLGIAVLVCLPFVAKKVFSGDTLLHDSKIWLAFSVFIYFFSVSGAMHNIIRKVPMFMSDRNNPTRLIYFYHGSGMQLGAEGFAVGSLYTLVGLLLAFSSHLLVKVKSMTTQRVVMILAMVVSVWAMKKVVYLDNWKTGYGIHGYWPSSWN